MDPKKSNAYSKPAKTKKMKEKTAKTKNPRPSRKKIPKKAKTEEAPKKKVESLVKEVKPRGPTLRFNEGTETINQGGDQNKTEKKVSKSTRCTNLRQRFEGQMQSTTWLCAFCKRGPNTNEFAHNEVNYVPGDLFGPYFITNECEEFTRRFTDPFDANFKSKTVALTCSGQVWAEEAPIDTQQGIAQLDAKTYEIWAHEECIIWAPGITLVDDTIEGLEEAVWAASTVRCMLCYTGGANIACDVRGCKNVMHVGCAYIAQWSLKKETFQILCGGHSQSP